MVILPHVYVMRLLTFLVTVVGWYKTKRTKVMTTWRKQDQLAKT